MAWLDFIKTIRQNDENEKKRGGWWGNTLNSIDNTIDSGSDLIHGRFSDAAHQFVDAAKSNWQSGAGVRDFVGDTLQSIPRGIVNLGLGVKEQSDDSARDSNNQALQEMLGMSEDERNKLADKWKDKNAKDKDGKSFYLSKTRDKLGSLSDDAIKAQIDKNKKESAGHETYKASNPFMKFLIGGESDEVAKSPQATKADAENFLEKQGVSKGVAAPLAIVGAGVNSALDVPTGLGNLVKGVGKQGIKELAQEGGEDAVKSILKSRLPKLSEETVAELAPRLAKATDEKAVAEVLTDAGKHSINALAAPIQYVKGNVKGDLNTAKSFVNKLPGVNIGQDAKIVTNGLDRPGAEVQKAIEDALNSGDHVKAQQLTDTITDPDLKAGMQSTLDALSGKPRPPRTIDPATGKIVEPTNKGSVVDTAVDKVKGVFKPSTPKPTGYGEATDELLGRVKYGSDIEKPKGGVGEQLKEQFVDKLSPIHDLVKTVEANTGKKLLTEDNPYELMRLYQGMPDRVQTRVQGLTDVLKQAPDINSVKAIGMARQILDRAQDVTDEAGNVIKKGITSTISPERARQVIEEQRSRLGDIDFDKAASVVDHVNDYNKQLLDDLRQEGIISDDAYKAIIDTGAHYFSKFNVIDHILKDDNNRALFASGGSYNTTKQTLNKILKTATGHQEGAELLDPIESIVRSTDATMRAIAKNQIWKSFDRMADQVPDLVQRVRDPENVLQRISLASDNAEMRPLRQKLAGIMRTQGQAVRELHTEINRLEKKGLNLSLKNGGERMADAAFDVAGLGGRVPTSQAGKNVPTTDAEKRIMDFLGEVVPKNPNKLGPRDTAAFVKNLIETGSRSDIDRIKKMVGNRNTKLTAVLDSLGEVKSMYDDVAGTIRENVGKMRGELADKEVPEGFALISGFGKGEQGKLAVPKEIADVFTGKTKAQQDYLTSTMSKVNNFVKQNFTSNNPAFALITNPIRDAKSFAYNAQDVKANPISIGKALVGGLAERIKKGDAYKRWVEAGGKSGFYADERTGETIAKDVSRKVNGVQIHNAKDFIREASRFVTAPLRKGRDALQGAASILEDAPRVAQFQASLKAGKSDAQAAFNARNVTVDFQQSGRIGQTINAWIPFLNARFQGTIKTVEAIKRNPARAAAVYAGLTAAPIALAALNNQRFPEVMKMIPDQDRDNNFVIVFGDHQDASGNYDQVIKIPKGDVDKVLGNPLENFMRYLAKDDPDSLGEMVTNMIGQALPIDVVKDDKFNASRAIGSVLPPLLKAPLESATNRNLYFDSDIVPQNMQDLPANEQVRKDDPTTKKVERSTSPVAEFLAPLLGGGSPIKSENTLRNFTGSLLTEKPQDQLGGKLSGSAPTKMNNEFYKILNQTTKNKNSASNHINQAIAAGNYAEAQRTAQAYNAYLRESFGPFAQTYGSQMTQELADLYDQQKIVLTSRSIKQRQRNQLERQAAQ